MLVQYKYQNYSLIDNKILQNIVLQQLIINYIPRSRMTDQKQAPTTYQFTLKIISVKMKIKFPCRMALEYNKQPITKQTPSTDSNRFLFNEDLTLKGTETHAFELLANIYTDKGTRYTSGTCKLLAAELLRSQGERLIVPLNKCLDPDAFCEIKVEEVANSARSMLRVSRQNSKNFNSPAERPDLFSPQIKKINSEKYLIGQTRSQANFAQGPAYLNPGSEQGRVRESTKTQIYKTFTKSPNNKFSNIKYLTLNAGGQNKLRNMSDFPVQEVASQRPSFAESEVYREGYQKLKEKFKKESELVKEESHKRMMLQANQNNYKLQIMKLKLKGEQQEKLLAERNDKIKNINTQLIELQKKDLDLAYLRQQNANLQRKVKLTEQTVHTLNTDIDSLKKLMVDKYKINQTTVQSLRNELQFAKAKIEEQKYQFQLQAKSKQNIILGKNNDLKMRTDTIERQKKLIKQMQQQSEAKLFQFQKTLSSERNALQSKIDQIKTKKSITETQKQQTKRKNSALLQQIQKHKSTLTALQYSKKLLSEESILLNKQIAQLKSIKQKHNQLQKQHKFLQEQFAAVRKSLQSSVQNKDLNINELIGKYEQGKDRHQKLKLQYQQRIRSLIIKTQQLQLLVQNTKNNLQKSKRTNDNLTKDNASLRQQSQQLRDELKSAQKRIISLEGDHSNHSTQYERDTASFKFLLQKYKDDKLLLQKDSDSLKEKIERLEEARKQYEEKENHWKVKERHLEDKAEKDSAKYKQTLNKYQFLIKQHQMAIAQLGATIESLNSESKQLKKKINQNDFSSIKTKQVHQRLKKDIKLSQEKALSFESQLKAKTQQLYLLSQKQKQSQSIMQQKQIQTTKLKEEVVQQTNKNNKQQKIIQLLNKDIHKLKNNLSQFQLTITTKQQSEQRLRQQIKTVKQQLAKQKIKCTKTEGEFDKFKQSINDIIRIEFTRILNSTPTTTHKNTQRLRQSQLSTPRSSRSRTKTALDATLLANTLAEKLHDTKNSLWKMAELSRALKAENVKLSEQSESENNKHQFSKLELHRDIQLLEDEMNNIINDKQAEYQSYDNMLVDLNTKLKERDMQIEELKGQIDESNAIITGLKTDFETNNDLNDKKVNTLKANISQLNERIQYLNLNVACLQDKNHQLQEKTIQQQNEIVSIKQMLIKHEKSVLDLKQSEDKLIIDFESLKKQNKKVLQNLQQKDIQLTSQKQTKQKYITMLEQQQKKSQKLNQFISTLIVQKETAIKNQLQKSEEINTLQNKLFETTHSNQVLTEENQNHRKKIEELKDQIKGLNKSVKSLQKQVAEQKTRYTRSLQKIKQRQSDLQIKNEYIKDIQDKYRQLRDKNYKQIKQLSNELQDKSTASLSLNKQLNDKILKLQNQSKKNWQENILLKNQLQTITRQIYKKNDRIEDLGLQLKKLRDDKITLEDELASKEFIIHQKIEQIKKLQDIVEQQKISFHNINSEYETHQKQFNLNINELTSEYNSKLETTSRQYEQKLELADRQQDFLREKLKATEDQLNKAQLQKKSQEIEHDQARKGFEQKIKKVESDRLSSTLLKNNQIKKATEQTKAYLDKLKQKESQTRKLSLQLEQLKLNYGRGLQFNTHALQQSKNKEKLLEKEIQSLKHKQQQYINYKQRLMQSIYSNEAQVRKIVAAAIKRLTESCSKSDCQKLFGVVKGLESSVVGAMMARLEKE